MFKKVILWIEFPTKNFNWKKAESLLKGIPHEVYVASKSVNGYNSYKKKTKLNLYAWPIISFKEGYWFSGFTSKKLIDELRKWKGIKIKIDLEPPLPEWEYTNFKITSYAIKKIFQKGKNNDYLKDVIYEIAKNNDVLINEFPFPKWYLKRQGIYLELKNKMRKNYMFYTSFAGPVLRPLVKAYLKIFTKLAVKKNPEISFSIGLIGTGILKKEGTYNTVEQFKEDLMLIEKSKARTVAVYSLDSIMKRKNSEEWTNAIKEFI